MTRPKPMIYSVEGERFATFREAVRYAHNLAKIKNKKITVCEKGADLYDVSPETVRSPFIGVNW